MTHMPTTKWLSIDDTHVLMRRWAHGELQEWHPVAQVTLRQIYPEFAPQYYALMLEADRRGEVITSTSRLEEAKAMAEVAAGVSSRRSEPTPAAPQP